MANLYERNGRIPENWLLNFTQAQTNGSKKPQQPIDVLCRIFPHKKRNVLELILQGCGGDTVQAIEQVIATQRQEDKPGNGLMFPGVTHSPLGHNIQSSIFKSAFSPHPSLTAASTLNSMRYAWGNTTGRGLAMAAMPYPHLLPGLSMGSAFPYSPLGSHSDKLSPYSMYPFWTGKPFPTKEVDKSPGCVSD